MDELFASPHRRFDPLSGRWVLNSPQRLERPWQGETFETPASQRPAYDENCYLCPGNVRANGRRNPDYTQTYAFDNDYPALRTLVAPAAAIDDGGLFTAQAESGRCRVLCFSPRHDLDVATMPLAGVRAVIDAWAREYAESIARPHTAAVTIFENRGAMMGASNPHPHSQIWTNSSVPGELESERAGFERYRTARGTCLLCAYAEREIATGERIVFADEHVCVVVPFWAVWPYETLVIARAHVDSLCAASDAERDSLAAAMHDLCGRYDRLFRVPFPYSMGWHQPEHLHAHYYPPLLRSASVRKYSVGYEMLAGPQRDITPEQAAERLRSA